MQKFNINSSVEVILTEFGAKVLNEKWYNMRMSIDEGLRALFNNIPTYKAGDRYSSQLWQLMQDFGDAMYNGGEVPFKNCEMYIVEKDLITVDTKEE